MSWGNRLILVFVAFAALIGTLVYKAVHTRFDLVSADYYKQELSYQQRINGIKNAGVLGVLAVEQNNTSVTIVMPDALKGAMVEGEAWFYRKSNADADCKVPLQINEAGEQVVNKRLLKPGPYLLKMDMKANGTNYYVEKELQVN
ncbi:FixH protein [Filimonas lacunae]|uniref:FixH protein n=1 Tax=Filimonas lacunae TaxID=477680 RepID=A0A173MP59_9BACT|nr:FixH family protein [Filimonas lacunae]BAV09230.1 hypothetical protein FLA_5278 [Filimonas lacunae]SIS69396.1 FixH protein [Filimonas lacunae]